MHALYAPALLALMTATPAQAGSRWLVNDGFEDGDVAGFQGGFVQNDCWGSIYVPDPSDYPFTLEKVRMLVGGSTASYIYTIHFYEFPGTTWDASASMGGEGVYITGSNESFNDVTVSELKLELPAIESGNVGVAVCLEEHSGFPAIARDTDGTISSDLNWIYDTNTGSWWRSSVFGLAGDWIMRLCIQGSGVTDEGCADGGGTGDGGATDGGSADGGSAGDGGATDGGSADGGSADGGSPDGGSPDGGADELLLMSITPDSVTVGEAADVVLLGQGFDVGTDARIGGISLVGLDVVNSETISGRTPTTLPVGVHDVEVVLDGYSSVLPGAFEVVDAGSTGDTGIGGDDGKGGGSCGCASGPRSTGLSLLGVMLGALFAGTRRRR